MREYFIDSNIFLRFFDSSSKTHQECKYFFQLIEEGKVRGIICSVVLLEIYFILKKYYKFSLKNCQHKIERILSAKNILFIDRFNYFKALDLSKETGIKFSDCLIASLDFFQKKNGIIVSYDKDFDKLGVKRIEPGKMSAK